MKKATPRRIAQIYYSRFWEALIGDVPTLAEIVFSFLLALVLGMATLFYLFFFY